MLNIGINKWNKNIGRIRIERNLKEWFVLTALYGLIYNLINVTLTYYLLTELIFGILDFFLSLIKTIHWLLVEVDDVSLNIYDSLNLNSKNSTYQNNYYQSIKLKLETLFNKVF